MSAVSDTSRSLSERAILATSNAARSSFDAMRRQYRSSVPMDDESPNHHLRRSLPGYLRISEPNFLDTRLSRYLSLPDK